MIDIVGFINATHATQLELSDKLGVSQSAISMVKTGKMDIPKSWIDIISSEYKVDVSDFTYDEDTLKEPEVKYNPKKTEENKDHLIKSILNLTESNKILAESVSEAIRLNSQLINRIKQELV
jgi:transcriptional regulator with XRE-family HTH domain